jgi:hypothetical protein
MSKRIHGIIPAGKCEGEMLDAPLRSDPHGLFYVIPKTIAELIEASVTNGRGYINLASIFSAPYAENPMADKIDPEEFCVKRLHHDKFPNWREDLEEGHPEYSKVYIDIIKIN